MYQPKGMMFAVLQAVRALKDDACGTEITQAIAKRARREIPSAQVYVALQRLTIKGLLQSTDQEHRKGRGHPRRFYTLTRDGEHALDVGATLYGSLEAA
mgnify:CR=1 FL=1